MASAQDARLDADAQGLIEAIHQTVAPAGQSLTTTDSERVHAGAGFTHHIYAPDSTLTDAFHADQERSVKSGSELETSGTGELSNHWADQRLGLDAGLTATTGRYNDSASAPVSAVIGQNYGSLVTYYRRYVATAGTTYAVTRLWQVFANADASDNYSVGLVTLGEGLTLGTTVYHDFFTSSRLQVKTHLDRELRGGDVMRTNSASYRIDHTIDRQNKVNASIGEDVVYDKLTGRTPSFNYDVAFNHDEGDTGIRLFAGRYLARRPVTNQQTLNDNGGLTYTEAWRPSQATLLVSASRNVERDVFGQSGLSAQTVDTGRVEYDLGVYHRDRLPKGRDYDKVVLSAQAERCFSVLGDVRRETFGLGYDAVF